MLRIELAGNLAGSGANGLVLGAGSGGSTIRGLAINRFAKVGVRIDGAGGNTIAGNFIGTNATGTAAAANGEDGVLIVSSANNTIGGVTPAAANLISGNTLGGVAIINTPSTGNKVQGNRIGVDVTGTVDLGNSGLGVLSFQGAGTIVGGTAPGAGNLISGNGLHGVWMLRGANNAVIQGNTIGTNLAGSAALGNSANGILIEDALNAQIGGAEPGAGNVISASSIYGIFLDDNSHDAVIKGNLIGTDRTGTQPLGNVHRDSRREQLAGDDRRPRRGRRQRHRQKRQYGHHHSKRHRPHDLGKQDRDRSVRLAQFGQCQRGTPQRDQFGGQG